MAIKTFGVTATVIRDHHFPQLAPFSTASKPTATVVGEKVDDAAADLAGRLAQEGLSAATLDDGSGAAYPNAYAWCARTIRLAAAIECLQAGATADPEVAKAWRAELEARWKRLDEFGYVALGDAPAPAQQANGPRSHLTELNLDTGDDTDASSAAPTFRKDDLL